MALLYKRWDTPRSLFGDVMVVTFVVMQCLDGVFTYLGVGIWGPAIEANPLISSAMSLAGVVCGVAGAKAVAISFGMLLHLRRVHNMVAALTAIYFAAAILPWTALFLTN
jgi:predicted CDP-diglyceride synthetase/phosphatidate cytidylyltransferase